MSSPYIGEIRIFAGNFPPNGWMFCDGQLIPISENDALFNLIGTTYGGDGQETFALPNLQSRIPLHAGLRDGRTRQIGETGGVEEVTLSVNQIPAHRHSVTVVTEQGDKNDATGNMLASGAAAQLFRPVVPAQVPN